jgi:hypothetical protein
MYAKRAEQVKKMQRDGPQALSDLLSLASAGSRSD